MSICFTHAISQKHQKYSIYRFAIKLKTRFRELFASKPQCKVSQKTKKIKLYANVTLTH